MIHVRLLWLSCAACALGILNTACAPKPPVVAPTRVEPVRALAALVPPGPSPVLLIRPRALFSHPETQLLWSTLVEPDDEKAFFERTGVDPRRVEEVLVFEVGKAGYAMLARGPFVARDVVLSAASRLAVPDVATDQPIVRREGLTGVARYAYAALDTHTLLTAKNASPTLIAAILARRTDTSLPTVFSDSDAASLYAARAEVPFALIAPRPLALPLQSDAAVLLAEERALAVDAAPESGSFRIGIELRGGFPEGAEHNFEKLVRSVAEAPLGKLLGLSEAQASLAVKRTGDDVLIGFRWPASKVALGLRTLFLDDLRALTR